MLQTYIDAWLASARDTLALLEDLDDAQWSSPTDLPGWTVADVAAHLAHLEAVTAGHVVDEAPTTASPGGLASAYTEAGVEARRGLSREQVLTELRAGIDARARSLGDAPPTDPSARADHTPAGVGWTWDTMLRNRTVDIWCHEQDVRRAVGRPGNLDSPAAVVTTHTFSFAMPYVLGKKVGATAGTSVLWDLTGPLAMQVGATVGDDGRARPGVPGSPSATLTLSSDAFAILAAGRRGPGAVDVGVAGDTDLAHRVLEQMAVTF
ncbi:MULTISPECIES: maleylpyruvate isomerase family mycothiol-dependent enzyme [unclassified Aeromicrobium]|uniref:maleylpyruvate isomerase family mycothiol-dependent enzyme n=1 Tax=unclassified Aeromicrobium TaxID=2633570 RepID=UPI00288BD2E3|nr:MULTISPECIES: maleylpyruvate isomerase family mycothiol-dependent enzyme [unclassified Aeromicrobium]